MKRNAIARIVIYSVLAFVLTGVLLCGILVDSFSIDLGGDGGKVVENELTLAAKDIQKLEIDWACGSISIRVADTDQIIITESAPENCKYKMTYDVNDSTLELDYGNRVSISCGNNTIPRKDLLITVPRDWVCRQIELDGAALDISMQDISVDLISLDGAANELTITGNVKKVDVDGASNSISLNCKNHPTSIAVEGASCELELTLPQGCGFTVNMEGLSCDFHSDLDYSTKNGQHIYGNGQTRVDVDGLSCDVTISESDT
jgi:hypothetical protein